MPSVCSSPATLLSPASLHCLERGARCSAHIHPGAHTLRHTPSPFPAGVRGLAAIKRSRALLRPLRWRLAVPFVGIVVALRLADAAKGYLLSNMPPRWVFCCVPFTDACLCMLTGMTAGALHGAALCSRSATPQAGRHASL